MSDERMIEKWPDYYLPADCPNCGRRRLEFKVIVADGEHRKEERLQTIRCEKCKMLWDVRAVRGAYDNEIP